jgi:hypothetical protein
VTWATSVAALGRGESVEQSRQLRTVEDDAIGETSAESGVVGHGSRLRRKHYVEEPLAQLLDDADGAPDFV